MNTAHLQTENMEYAYIEQIMYDMKNGVMAFDKKGRILYANPEMTSYFEKEDLRSETVQSLMLQNDNPENDGFWDILLDVVRKHAIHYQKKVRYVSPSGQVYSFHVTSSYLSGSTERDSKGIVLTITDETQQDLLAQKKHDSTIVLVGMLMMVCLTVLVSELYVFLDGAFPHDWIARCTEISGVIFLLIALKYTNLTIRDFGLIPTNFKKELLEAVLVVAVMFLGLSAAKAILIFSGSPMFPADKPFFDFSAPPDFYYIKYIGIAFMQELLTKCGLQKSISKILETRHKNLISVIITALMFMALHTQHGLVYMLGAGALSAVLAVLYNRHNSLLCTCIVHYAFGILGLVLHWIK